MKRVILTVICAFVSIGLSAQLGKKVAEKKLGSVLTVKPGDLSFKNAELTKNFKASKLPILNVTEKELKIPSRKKVKITPKKLYHQHLEIRFSGIYTKNYIISGDYINGGIIYFNAQQNKRYRLKIVLADRKHLLADLNKDFPNGLASIQVGNQGRRYSVNVNQNNREINMLFTTSEAGRIPIVIHGIFTSNWKWGDELSLPIKYIQVDEI
ncbi:hypothetical protein [Flagellimonas sp.]|uniref:hypothetical protein n=1 Tax=Flagellimonas sp. TaxID=2058762 RepID=UPI003F4A45BC